MADSIRVLIAEDNAVLRQSLVQAIDNAEGIEIVGAVAAGRDAVEECRRLHPQVVIMDYSLPMVSGSEAARRIRSHCPEVRVVGYTMHDEPEVLEEMRQAGAAAVVRKDAGLAELLEALHGP